MQKVGFSLLFLFFDIFTLSYFINCIFKFFFILYSSLASGLKGKKCNREEMSEQKKFHKTPKQSTVDTIESFSDQILKAFS